MAPFRKMSNSSDRSSPALYYFEESWQRLTHVLRLTGRTLICIQSACTNKQHSMQFINIFDEVKRTKGVFVAVKMKCEPSGQERACFLEATLALDRGRGCCTGPANASKSSNQKVNYSCINTLFVIHGTDCRLDTCISLLLIGGDENLASDRH